MAEERIDSYLDLISLKRETDTLLSYIQQLETAKNNFTKAVGSIGVASNPQQYVQASTELVAVQKELTDLTAKYSSVLKQLEQQQNATGTATRQRAAASKELTLEQALETEALKKHNAEMRQQAKDTLATTNTLEKLRTELALASAKMSKLDLGSEGFKAAQKDVLALTNSVKELESKSGDFRRNVGNYPPNSLNGLKEQLKEVLGEYNNLTRAEQKSVQGIELKNKLDGLTKSVGEFGEKSANSFTKAYSGLRTLANILPGLGISGIFLLAYEGISALISALSTGSKSLGTFAANYKNVTDVVAEANKGAGKQIADLKILYAGATDVNNSIDDRRKAVKALQTEFPDYFGKIDAEIILNGKAKKSYDELSASIITSSRAAAAKTKIDQLEAQKLDIDFQRQKIKNATDNEKANAQAKIDANVQTDEFGNQIKVKGELQFVQTAINQRRVKALRDEDLKEQSINQQEQFLVAFVGQKKITKVVVDENTNQKKAVKTITDAVADLRKELAGIDLKQGLGELAPKDADIERVKAYDKAFEDIGKRGGTLNTPIVKDLKLELSPIEQRVIEQQIKDLIAKLPRITEVLNPPKEELQKVYDTYKSYAEGEAKFYEEIAQRELVVSQTKEANEKAILAKSYADRKISKEEYENGILNITDKYGRLGLAIQAKWLAEEIKLLPPGTKAREDAEKKLAELQILLNQRVLTDDQKTAQQRARILEGYFQKVKDAADQVMDVISGFVNNSVTSQKNANQELDNQRQITFENDVARINASTDTEEVKANKIKLLEAQRQAQKEKLERDQRQLDLQRARFEKAQTITNIILGTTVAVLHQLSTGDPFTAFARAIAVGAIGAAQLAIAISAPLPKFKHGKFNNYEGAAIVGDGGKREPIVRADGSIEMSPDTPTLTWIGSKDLVFPDVEALRNRVAMSQTDRVLSNGVLLQQNNLIDLKPLEKKMDGVIQAYMSRPVQHTVWTEKGVVTRVQNGFSQTEYINQYVRGL